MAHIVFFYQLFDLRLLNVDPGIPRKEIIFLADNPDEVVKNFRCFWQTDKMYRATDSDINMGSMELKVIEKEKDRKIKNNASLKHGKNKRYTIISLNFGLD